VRCSNRVATIAVMLSLIAIVISSAATMRQPKIEQAIVCDCNGCRETRPAVNEGGGHVDGGVDL
jgi:hypothetical protein